MQQSAEDQGRCRANGKAQDEQVGSSVEQIRYADRMRVVERLQAVAADIAGDCAPLARRVNALARAIERE
jgi:hypothetical protein